MFARFFGRSGASDDLAEYRAHYPTTAIKEDPRANDNLLFYKNEIAGTDGVLIDVFHKNLFGKYAALEQGHSYVQWIAPIREQSAFNCDSQPLMLHEIASMKADPLCLRRAFLSLRLMLDFYGFDMHATMPGAPSSQPSSKAAAYSDEIHKKNQDDQDDGDDESAVPSAASDVTWQSENFPWANLSKARVIVQRQKSEHDYKPKFRNLIIRGHNNLRVTRLLKFAGELGLENIKISMLLAFHQEIFVTQKLSPLASSFLNYWSGTVYDDKQRAALQQMTK